MKNKRLGMGWKPDTPDLRDYVYSPRSKGGRLPKAVDLSERFFTVWNQGTLGSCTAQTVGAAALFRDIYDRDLSIIVPSRHFIYYNTRVLEGTEAYDSGAEIRNAIKALSKFGYPSEEVEPYRIKAFDNKPSARSYKAALKQKIKRYERVERNLSHFRKLLHKGFPIAFGFTVYESIYLSKVTKSGLVPVPTKKEKTDGGHAVLCVGYDDEREAIIFRNSWGKGWGRGGYGFLPYEYILDANLSDDFWVIIG